MPETYMFIHLLFFLDIILIYSVCGPKTRNLNFFPLTCPLLFIIHTLSILFSWCSSFITKNSGQLTLLTPWQVSEKAVLCPTLDAISSGMQFSCLKTRVFDVKESHFTPSISQCLLPFDLILIVNTKSTKK